MKTDSFTILTAAFIDSLIRLRQRLIRDGKSKNPSALFDLQFIKLHFEAYPNRSEKQMVRFWMKNRSRIFNLIPGIESGSHEALKAKYDEINRRASTLYTSYMLTPVLPFSPGQGHKASVL